MVQTNRNRTLQRLRLDDNGLSYAGFHALRKALARNTRLLDLPYPQRDADTLLAYVIRHRVSVVARSFLRLLSSLILLCISTANTQRH